MEKHRNRLLKAIALDAERSVEEVIALGSGYPDAAQMRAGLMHSLLNGLETQKAIEALHEEIRRDSASGKTKVRARDFRKMSGHVQAARRDNPGGGGRGKNTRRGN